jgi:hypothetical protein
MCIGIVLTNHVNKLCCGRRAKSHALISNVNSSCPDRSHNFCTYMMIKGTPFRSTGAHRACMGMCTCRWDTTLFPVPISYDISKKLQLWWTLCDAIFMKIFAKMNFECRSYKIVILLDHCGPNEQVSSSAKAFDFYLESFLFGSRRELLPVTFFCHSRQIPG